MRRSALVAALLLSGGCSAIGCATKAQKPKPTAKDVVSFKDELGTIADETSKIADEAKLNPRLTDDRRAKIDEQVAAIRAQVKALQHHEDQLAEAAGVGTTVK